MNLFILSVYFYICLFAFICQALKQCLGKQRDAMHAHQCRLYVFFYSIYFIFV